MLCFLQTTFILFTLISQITSIPFTFTVTNFTITPQDPLPLHNTSYNFSYTLLEYMPGGVITQLILPSPYNIPGYEKKVFDYSGYPEDMMFESFVQGPNLILDIKNNYEVPAGSRMNLKVGPFKNPDHNRYYNQTLTMTFEEGPQNLHYTTTFDPHFRLKNFGTSPPLMAILESYVLGNTSRHWISVNTSVIVFSASKFVFDFATQIDISGSACQLDPMSFIGALCAATSPSQITIYFPQERSPGVYNFSLSNVINPNITNVSSPYTMTFTSFDWEGLVMEKSVLNYPYQCSEGCQVCNATQCLHCFPSSYLDMGICVTTCPFGSYPDDELKICRRDCVDGCLECTGTKTNCSKCVPQLSLLNFSCISECPNPYTSVENVCMNISKPSSTLSVSQEISSSKGNMRFDVVLGTIPVFSIYIGICFLIWVWSGISCKASMNVTSLMVLLSSMEPCLYIYLLVTAISFGISLLSALFVFLVTAKVTLQAFYVTTSLQNLTFFELDSDSKRSSLLKILEYSYNLKLGFLRDTQLFGRKSLRLSRNARKNMNKALLSPLKASMAIEILVVLGYIGYYITVTIQHEAVRLLHIESAAFLALQVLVGVFQTVRMKRSTNRYVVNMRESATTRSSSVNNRAQGLNESSMQKLNQEESSGKIELDKSGDLSLQDIVIMRKEDKSSRVETKESNHNKELAKEINKDNNAENCLGPDKMDTGHKDWEGEGSVIIEVNDGPEQKKESVETFGQRSGSKKKSPFSLKRRLQMMSDKVVKTLANFSSTKKKRQAIEINDIKAFVKTKSSEPDAVDKKTIERTMSLANDRGRQYLVENDEDGVVPGQTQEKWWSLGKEMSFGNLVKQPYSAEKPDSEVNRELYDGKVVFTKGSQPGKFLFNNGKFILHRFVKKKAENRSQNVEEVVLEK